MFNVNSAIGVYEVKWVEVEYQGKLVEINATSCNSAVARPRVTVYFSEEIYKYLVERADRELRTVANLVEYLVVQSVQQEQNEQQKAQQKPQE
ncbi:hypothetical protein [Microseira sp. BLCC-F43]|jgi:hypothetical protein|uniref:ribbon-helix-helix domain-containing protein n=1 Tax=Microseira sp. BLCC-F43 TaxID=3153602 RepID=UPI0035BA5D0B